MFTSRIAMPSYTHPEILKRLWFLYMEKETTFYRPHGNPYLKYVIHWADEYFFNKGLHESSVLRVRNALTECEVG